MNDLVSRKAVIDAIMGEPPEDHYPSWYAGKIMALPDIQQESFVELIHCKDCEWWTKRDKIAHGRCELMQMYPTGEWFCGNAQKRESKDEKQ